MEECVSSVFSILKVPPAFPESGRLGLRKEEGWRVQAACPPPRGPQGHNGQPKEAP